MALATALAHFSLPSVPAAAWKVIPHVGPQVLLDFDMRFAARAVADIPLERATSQWRLEHMGVLADSCRLGAPSRRQDQVDSQKRMKRGCFESQMCMCSGDGKRYKKFKGAVTKAIKATFKGDERHLLVNGFAVFKLTSRRPPDWGEGDDEVSVRYFHIAHQHLKPWVPTILEMQLCHRQQCLAPNVLLEPRLQRPEMDHSGAPYCMLAEILISLDRRYIWEMSFLTLVADLSILPRPFIPGSVEARPAGEAVHVWTPLKVTRKRKKDPAVPICGPCLAPLPPPALDDEDHEGADGEDSEMSDGSSPDLSEDSEDPDESSAGDDDDDSDGSEMSVSRLLDMLDDGEGSSDENLSDEYESVSSFSFESSERLDSTSDGSDGDESGSGEHDPSAASSGSAASAAVERIPRRRGRGAALEGLDVWQGEELKFPNGIRFSEPDGKFYATCLDRRHNVGMKCVLTRTCRPGPKKAQGRPLGFLAAWLLSHEASATQHDHVFNCRPSRERRRQARRDLSRSPNLPAFLIKERPKRDGEESEPEGDP